VAGEPVGWPLVRTSEVVWFFFLRIIISLAKSWQIFFIKQNNLGAPTFCIPRSIRPARWQARSGPQTRAGRAAELDYPVLPLARCWLGAGSLPATGST